MSHGWAQLISALGHLESITTISKQIALIMQNCESIVLALDPKGHSRPQIKGRVVIIVLDGHMQVTQRYCVLKTLVGILRGL